MTPTVLYIDVTDTRTGERAHHEFRSFPVSIGRVAQADLRLTDSRISRIHARLELVDGMIEIHDSSTNGTFIDGVLLFQGTSCPVGPSTGIEIGPYMLRVSQVATDRRGATAAARPAASPAASPAAPPRAPPAAPPRARPPAPPLYAAPVIAATPAMPARGHGRDEVQSLLNSFERQRQAAGHPRSSELVDRLTRASEPTIDPDEGSEDFQEMPPGKFEPVSRAPAEVGEPDLLDDMPGPGPLVAACSPPCSPVLVPEARVLDLALPLAPVRAETCRLFVLIRLPASTGLLQRLADGTSAVVAESVTSSDMLMEFFTLADGSAVPVSLIVRLDSTDFAFAPDSKRVRLHRGRDAALLCFELTPLRTGLVRVAVEVSLESDVIGAGLVNRTCLERNVRAPVSEVAYGDMSLRLDFQRESSHPASQPIEADLHAFLTRSFTAEELHRWICLNFRGWRTALPDASGSVTALAFAVLETGQREGRLNDSFFAALTRHLPRRAAQIHALRDRWETEQELVDPWPGYGSERAAEVG